LQRGGQAKTNVQICTFTQEQAADHSLVALATLRIYIWDKSIWISIAMKRPGRPPKHPDRARVSATLPRALIDRVDDYAEAEICANREVAIRELLERALSATDKRDA